VRTEGGGDHLQHTDAVRQNIVVPEAKDPPPLSTQRLVSESVITHPAVLPTVRLNDEAGLDTRKIDYVGRDRMLPSEPPSELLAMQPIPKEALRFCRIPPQTASTPNRRAATPHASNPPPTPVKILPHLFGRSKLGVPAP
jgi:hypothetical protein